MATVEDLLTKYGYVEGKDGIYRRGATTHAWRKVDGGWERLDPPTGFLTFSLEGGSEPRIWGKFDPETGWYLVPYRLTDEFSMASGLHPAQHPGCFIWVWPDEVVAGIYELALKDSNQEA